MMRHRRPEHAPLVAVMALLIVAVLVLGVAVVTAADRGRNVDGRRVGYGQIAFQGLGPERWAQRWRIARRELAAARHRVTVLTDALRAQRRIVLRKPQVVEAINLACIAYGHCATLWRKARCETGGTFSATAYNASGASGLFQFLRSTWLSTPYARLSVWSPYANALAAGWMHDAGRGGEWTCR